MPDDGVDMQRFMKFLCGHKNFSNTILQKDGYLWGWKNITIEEITVENFKKAVENLKAQQ